MSNGMKLPRQVMQQTVIFHQLHFLSYTLQTQDLPHIRPPSLAIRCDLNRNNYAQTNSSYLTRGLRKSTDTTHTKKVRIIYKYPRLKFIVSTEVLRRPCSRQEQPPTLRSLQVLQLARTTVNLAMERTIHPHYEKELSVLPLLHLQHSAVIKTVRTSRKNCTAFYFVTLKGRVFRPICGCVSKVANSDCLVRRV